MELYIAIWCLIVVRLVNAKQILPKMKKNEISLLERARYHMDTTKTHPIFRMPNVEAHVQPLPSPKPKFVLPTSYTSLYQGVRHKDDKRVFRKRFDYEAKDSQGQRVICHGLFDCVLAYISIESTEGIPVLLRGGAGYRHFTAVVRSKPYKELKGQVRAYCRNNYMPAVNDTYTPQIKKRGKKFYFGNLYEENDST